VLRAGRALPQGLRTERMNSSDLDVHLRLHGLDRRGDVREAAIEQTGEMSVLLTDEAQPARRRDLEEGRAA
jgi:uncharacterized membrane protein YcaP (DUF421 family)